MRRSRHETRESVADHYHLRGDTVRVWPFSKDNKAVTDDK
jgi:hypothetical protein